MTPDNSLAIDLHDVAKTYKGKVHALQGIDMRVRRGEVYGLLGPNGAGKSTLVKIMMTVIRPTRAQGTILGSPVGSKATLQRVGYLPENHRFPRYLTGRQTLEFFGAMQKVDRPTRKRRAAELLNTVGMTAWADKKISSYSKGMLQRVGIAQALISDPDLVVLDEPTDGVDPVGRRDIRDVLVHLRNQGKTVFINSHLLSELEMICDRVAIMVKGRLAKQGTLDELTVANQRYEIEIESAGDPAAQRKLLAGATSTTLAVVPAALPISAVAAPGNAPPPVVRLPAMRGKLPSGEWVELDGTTLRIGVTDAAAIQPIVDSIRLAGLVIRRIQPVRQSLEDLFMEAVTDPTTGMAATPGAGPIGGRP
jgi:ABC-2 type transport system ATP-binding protein